MRKIRGFVGYFVTSTGEVWTNKDPRKRELHEMIQKENKHGHRYVQLCNGRHVKRYVHRLVLEAFVGPCPEGMQCRHLDGNPRNNNLENLCWGTPTENQADKIEHGTTNRGSRNGMAKLTETSVLAIREEYATGRHSQASLCEKYNVDSGNMSNIVNGKAWRHLLLHPAFKAKVPGGEP